MKTMVKVSEEQEFLVEDELRLSLSFIKEIQQTADGTVITVLYPVKMLLDYCLKKHSSK